ncbi:glycosyltransferase family 2 protein [Grimontia marina]|uniref:N-acetylglucosaminyl-diphospho-decaprenol L-rhamnosyltransferase n=1 Tax=Grimontia marina TaxID=646534 RepID=A0A128ETA1_9GAMM|nr:glycosyltransferase family 2 protein [Grimontia marina]CZF77335.1 N-acetylglucosaminyl-diphospho-decaprenol L-rhamnosyltransferase [Grimontia marina]
MLDSNLNTLDVSIVVYGHSKNEIFDVVSSLLVSCDSSFLTEVNVYIADNKGDFDFKSFRLLVESVDVKLKYAVNFLTLDQNPGYGAANNRCIEIGDGYYHLVLNPDVIFEKDSMTHALELIKCTQDNILVSPKIVDEEQGVISGIKRYPSILVLSLRFMNNEFLNGLFSKKLRDYECRDLLEADEPASVEIATGCCMLLRKKHLIEIGSFDDRYFLYFEDFDLSIRLRRLGKLVYCPGFVVSHFGGHTGKKGFKHISYFLKSMLGFFYQHGVKVF